MKASPEQDGMKKEIRDAGTLTAEEWLRFYDFWKRLLAEQLPYRELESHAEFHKAWTVFPQPVVIRCVVLFSDNNIIGCARYWHEDRNSAHHAANKELFNSDLYLLEAGPGGIDLQYLVNHIQSAFVQLRLSIWQLGIFQESLVAKVLSLPLAFRQVNRQAFFRLEVAKADGALLKQWVDAHPSLTVQRLDLADSETLRAFVKFSDDVQADIPIQESVPTVRTHDLDYWRKRMKDLQDKHQQLLAYGVYEGGELIAVTSVIGRMEQPSTFEVELTGVRRDQRGRGLAKLVKAYSFLELKTRFPSFRWMLTGTNS